MSFKKSAYKKIGITQETVKGQGIPYACQVWGPYGFVMGSRKPQSISMSMMDFDILPKIYDAWQNKRKATVEIDFSKSTGGKINTGIGDNSVEVEGLYGLININIRKTKRGGK